LESLAAIYGSIFVIGLCIDAASDSASHRGAVLDEWATGVSVLNSPAAENYSPSEHQQH